MKDSRLHFCLVEFLKKKPNVFGTFLENGNCYMPNNVINVINVIYVGLIRPVTEPMVLHFLKFDLSSKHSSKHETDSIFVQIVPRPIYHLNYHAFLYHFYIHGFITWRVTHD